MSLPTLEHLGIPQIDVSKHWLLVAWWGDALGIIGWNRESFPRDWGPANWAGLLVVIFAASMVADTVYGNRFSPLVDSLRSKRRRTAASAVGILVGAATGLTGAAAIIVFLVRQPVGLSVAFGCFFAVLSGVIQALLIAAPVLPGE